MHDLEASRLVGEVVARLAQTGLPHGHWLLRIEQALLGVQAVETLLHDLRDAIVTEYADERETP